MPRLSVPEQDRVLRGFVLAHDRRVHELEAAQPFHVHIAFKAGQQQAQRIAVRGPHFLAVLIEAQKRVIHCLGEREAAAHGGGIGTFRHDPFGGRIDPRLVQKRGEPHPGPLRAGHQSVDRRRVERLRLRRVERATVAGAFEESNPRFTVIAGERFHREDQRPLDQAMDHEPVLVGIDVRCPGMAAVEVQAVRRDHSVEQLDRRARGADSEGARVGGRWNSPRGFLIFRGLPVTGERRARLLHPGRHRQRLGTGLRGTDAGDAGERRRFEKDAAAQHAVTRRRLAERLHSFAFPRHTNAPLR